MVRQLRYYHMDLIPKILCEHEHDDQNEPTIHSEEFRQQGQKSKGGKNTISTPPS